DAPVERCHGLSREAFYERFRHANRPCVLTDEAARWPACQRWTDEYLIDKFGGRPLDVSIHPDGMYTAHGHAVRRTRLADLIRGYRDDPEARALVCHVLTLAPYLIPDFSLPSVVAPEVVEDAGFWVKPQTTTTGLHFDHRDGLLGLVRGRKRVLLFAPEQYERLYPCPLDSVDDSHKRNWSAVVNIFDPSYTEFPGLADAVYHEVFLDPGDMLFIPRFWWHAMDHHADLTLSINFFLATGDQTRWPLFYRDRVFIEQLLAGASG
ncbi:MAG: cupin-like domain-containing protein, partial [Myxococcota bacterium]